MSFKSSGKSEKQALSKWKLYMSLVLEGPCLTFWWLYINTQYPHDSPIEQTVYGHWRLHMTCLTQNKQFARLKGPKPQSHSSRVRRGQKEFAALETSRAKGFGETQEVSAVFLLKGTSGCKGSTLRWHLCIWGGPISRQISGIQEPIGSLQAVFLESRHTSCSSCFPADE